MSIKQIVLCGVAAIVVIVLVFAMIYLPKGRSDLVGVRCQNNIKKLGLALILYAEDNNGNLPDKNYPEGILMAANYFNTSDLKILFCPSKSTYRYLAGLSYEFPLNFKRVPLVWDEGFPHNGKKSVCFMDGNSDLLDESHWETVKPILLKKNL